MTTKTIDRSKCIGCGKCVADCVTHYITLTEDDNCRKKASFVERGRCIECGHCIAICPQSAISGGKASFEFDADADILLSLMARKRTIRRYCKNVEVPQASLDCILMAAQSAPTEKNRKSGRIVLIKENLPKVYNFALDALVEEVKKSGPINPLYAPTMEMDANRNEMLWNAEYLVVFIGSSSNLTEACISAERMQLMASHCNIGTAYRGDMKTGINASMAAREFLNMRPNEEVLVSFTMGITQLKYSLPLLKSNRKIEII